MPFSTDGLPKSCPVAFFLRWLRQRWRRQTTASSTLYRCYYRCLQRVRLTKSANGKRPRFRLRAFHAPHPHNQSPIRNGTAPTTPTSMSRCRYILWAALMPDLACSTTPQFVLKLDGLPSEERPFGNHIERLCEDYIPARLLPSSENCCQRS